MNAETKSSPLPVVVGLGEVLWDVFPEGAQLGGAPANFACHAAALGVQASIVSVVGRDELGDRTLEALVSRGVEVNCICLLYTSPSPRDRTRSRMPSSA